MNDIALSATDIVKRYGAVVAVDSCTFELRRGEVHVLLGSNGCGKSTLCKVIAGAVAADAGTVSLEGKTCQFRGPLDAKSAGIATVYQELSLVPTLTVAENILLSDESTTFGGGIDRVSAAQRIKELTTLAGSLAKNLDLEAWVGDLPIDQQQIVEILKSLRGAPRVIVFDESTSSLDRSQVAAFFGLVRKLKLDGVSIIFITHRMEEIFAIADRVTVMRNGQTVATQDIAETSREHLVTLMVDGERGTPQVSSPRSETGPPILAVNQLSSQRVNSVSLTLKAGEILGLGGLHGQGQSDFLLALFGAIPAESEVHLDGRPVVLKLPLKAIAAGFCYVSGDRGRAGALHGRPITENLGLSFLSRSRAFLFNKKAMQEQLADIISRINLKFGKFDHAIGTLSGGNQQKVIFGRALAAAPRILLLDDPTKGIDVQAKVDLYNMIRVLCAQGTAVILYSSEDSELLANADRVLVFNSGSVVDELAGSRLTEHNLYTAALRSAE